MIQKFVGNRQHEFEMKDMFEIEKTFKFEAGHQLIHHDGKCSTPHGHSYSLSVRVRGIALNDSGPKKNMILDFCEISKAVAPLINDYLDHKWLNDTLESDSPTAEYIARWIFQKLKPRLHGLYAVKISETATSHATYTAIDM